jgi:uncharacterized protein (DUF983 family)
VCGSGGVFRHWFSMAERCPRCDFRFEREQGEFIGAIGINTIVTFGVLLVAVLTSVVLTYPDDVAVALVITMAVALVFPVFFYPFSKTLWLAINLAMRPLEPGEARPPWGQPT